MATKNFLSLEGLTQYDSLIKNYIGTEDAKSIKSITVVGNTVSFFKTNDASGTASYTVNLPDVSNFMELIANAEGDKVLISNSNGEAVESEYGIYDGGSVDGLVLGYFSAASTGDIAVWDADSNELVSGEVNVEDLMTKIDSAGGDKVVASNIDGTVYESEIDIDDVLTKITNAGNGNVVVTNSDGTIAEIDVAGNSLITGYYDDQIGHEAGDIIVYSDGSYKTDASHVNIDDLATNDYVGEIPSGAEATTIVGYVDEVVDALDQSLAAIAKSGDSGDASYDNASSGLTATNVQSAIDEVVDGLGTAAAADIATSAIDEGSTDDNLVSAAQVATFVAAEIAGLEGAMHFRGVITRQTGETDAQAIARVITNPEAGDVVVMSDNAKEYIYESSTIGWKEVGDETEFVKKTTTIAGVDLQDSITKTELLTALNVEDGAEVNIVESVKVNGSALTPDANRAVNVTVAEGSANGTISVNSSNVAVHGLGSAAYEATTAFDASGAADTAEQNAKDYADSLASNYDAAGTAAAAIADLDSSVSIVDSGNTNPLNITITQTDGELTSVTGSIDANTFDSYGAASTVQSTVIGASGDAATANTIYGAKAYADASTGAIATADIQALFS